ncbi:MAG TPA: NAD(P)/FAD-dependent oxidoreductase [Blastocatellia bacterium]|nr:NAD(P)/FAD-dependent oxidoreductase [Blastocatellia bacterium]
MELFDVIIVGAGLSGIGAAVHLQRHCPGKSYAILEGREAIGGTWDLFRYPGVRSDSDMHTLGYNFKPWKLPRAIADGDTIRAYVQEAAEEYGVVPHVRFKHLVRRLSWSSADAMWTVEAEHDGRAISFKARYVMMCAGYYRYSAGYAPEFAGVTRFKGTLIHPQFWPEDLDYSGKRVVVIGSGATAVTLVPAMAEKASRVTMLQRSPTYILSLPAADAIANWLRSHLPLSLAYLLTRWKNVVLQIIFFNASRAFPEQIRKRLLNLIQEQLGPEYDLAHFTPRYNPWDERLCVVPDNDLFTAIRAGKVSIVTDHINSFTETGLKLQSGRDLEADIVVTATGLEVQFIGGAEIMVDERPIEIGKTVLYKGMMFSGVPNLASVFGYTNASWTLRADLLAEYFCRLINFMDARGYEQARPKEPDPAMPVKPLGNLKSGYLNRAEARLPRQGTKGPWRNPQNYVFDIFRFRLGPIEDNALEFRRAGDSRGPETSPAAIADAKHNYRRNSAA